MYANFRISAKLFFDFFAGDLSSPKQLEAMLDEKLNMHNVEKYLAVIAANSGKGIYLDDGTLVGRLLPAIDSGLGQTQKLNARLSL